MAFNVGGGGGSGPTPQMNVTPLVDVVLVLLIIFMVVAPLLVKQLHLATPPQQTQAQPPPQSADDQQVVVRLDADGTVRVNSAPIDPGALEDKMRRVFAARVDDVVFFEADEAANYAQAVAVMDTLRAAGALTIGVVTEGKR